MRRRKATQRVTGPTRKKTGELPFRVLYMLTLDIGLLVPSCSSLQPAALC